MTANLPSIARPSAATTVDAACATAADPGGMDDMTTAAEFFAARLRFQTDPADLAAARARGDRPLILDVRSPTAWRQGRLPDARLVPLPELGDRIGEIAPDRQTEIVVYCWGPGCNGSTRAGLVLAELGYTRVRELLGGFEYWAREGLAVVVGDEPNARRERRSPDPLTAPASP